MKQKTKALTLTALLTIAPFTLEVSFEGLSAKDNVELKQNYPNPFYNKTTIEHKLEDSSRVNLTVYDNLGKPLQTLVDTVQAPGTHKVEFDATYKSSGTYPYIYLDESLNELYHYRLITDITSKSQKMIRVK